MNELIINATTTETRIALMEEGRLAELFVERPEHERNVGDIYKGRVRKVLAGISAAFIEIGWEQDGFLHFNDAGHLWEGDDEDSESNGRGPSRKGEINLKSGQDVYVQITKEPISNKGPRVTSEVSLPGRFVVLVPHASSIGVSRKIADPKEKRRLKALARKLKPVGCGLIVRTVAADKSEELLSKDIESLHQLWKKVEKKGAEAQAPALIYKEVSLASSVIRDLFTPQIDRLIVDSKKIFDDIQHYLEPISPQLLERVELYRKNAPIFDHFHIEQEIEKGIRRKVWLEGGGHIIIEHTEAMVTVDVNSGKYVGNQNHEENSLKINLRAARELCRQLRLRDIGGIIAVDFIDMWEDKNRKKVYDEMKKELKRDRAKADVAPIGPFGIMVMTRQRIKPSLLFTFKEVCPACHGTGMVASKETVVTELERWISRFRTRSGEKRIQIRVHPDMRRYLLENPPINRLNRIMLRKRIFIRLHTDSTISPSEFFAWSYRRNADVTDEYRT